MTAAFRMQRWAVAWLSGSFALFLLVGEVSRVPDMTKLIAFVCSTIIAFASGYWMKAKHWQPEPGPPPMDNARRSSTWVVIGAAYATIYGLTLLIAYGATGPADILESLRNPGAAYFFRLREAQVEEGNAAIQILTLGSALSTPVVPFLIIYWERLGSAIRSFAIIGAAVYSAYWIFIGTQKGIGDFACYAIVALLVRSATRGRKAGRRTVAWITILATAFAMYMVFNQSARLTSQNTTGGIEPNPIVASFFGDNIGRGVTTTLYYPTHGYLGLSYNLETPHEWTRFRGASRAFDSYWIQYVEPQEQPIFSETLPALTEQRTGWPALLKWSTIYPWLASDLTWFGAAVFMFPVGWMTAKWWLEAVYEQSKLALLLVGQMAILIAYVPANNQIGITRGGLIAFASLLLLYTGSRIARAHGRRLRAASTTSSPPLASALPRRSTSIPAER